jgi:N-hydroxyarylamine O-acetyltransferase
MPDLYTYLRRIGYQGSQAAPRPDITTLREICRGHSATIPFETLEMFEGVVPATDVCLLFDKIVTQRRGGICIELNGLLAHFLQEIGFSVTIMAGGVALPQGRFSTRLDHSLLLVDVGGQAWLTDVGFSGASFFEPIPFPGAEQHQHGWAFFVEEEDGYHVVYRRDLDGQTVPLFRFTLQAYQLAEFRDVLEYHTLSPASPFPQTLICARTTDGGKITLVNDRVTVADRGRQSVTLISDMAEREHVLSRIFAGHEHLTQHAMNAWRKRH